MDFSNSSKPYEWDCTIENKPWMKIPEVQDYYKSYLVLSISSIAVALIATLSNILLISAILTSPNLKTPSYRLVACQAFSDLVMALYLAGFASFFLLGIKGMLKTACYLWHVTFVLVLMGSFVSMISSALLSIDRYLAVYLGIRYKSIVTLKRVRIAIFGVWVISPCVAILLRYFDVEGFLPTAFTVLIVGALCYSVMTFCYTNAFKLLTRYSETSLNSVGSTTQEVGQGIPGNHGIDTTNSNATSRLQLNKYRKSMWTLIIVEVVFSVMAAPVMCAWVNMLIQGNSSTSRLFLAYSSCIWGFASAVNPGIHIYRMEDVRQACWTVLTRLSGRSR